MFVCKSAVSVFFFFVCVFFWKTQQWKVNGHFDSCIVHCILDWLSCIDLLGYHCMQNSALACSKNGSACSKVVQNNNQGYFSLSSPCLHAPSVWQAQMKQVSQVCLLTIQLLWNPEVFAPFQYSFPKSWVYRSCYAARRMCCTVQSKSVDWFPVFGSV